MKRLKLPAWKVGDRGFEPHSGLQVSKKKCFFSAHSQRLNIVGSLRDQQIRCSASAHKGSNLESSVWKAVSSHSSHHPQEALLTRSAVDVGTILCPHWVNVSYFDIYRLFDVGPPSATLVQHKANIEIFSLYFTIRTLYIGPCSQSRHGFCSIGGCAFESRHCTL